MGVAVADGAEVAVGVGVALEPQPVTTKTRSSIREKHAALLTGISISRCHASIAMGLR